MPYLEYPKSDAKRLEFMELCVKTAEQDIAQDKKYIPAKLVATLSKTSADFRAISTESNSSLADKN
jgi:hypothetical protein